MPLKTGGEATVEALIAQGVDTLFGLPGIQNDWLYNALFDNRDRIRVIHTRHEQGCAYMALGYTLASGKPGVFTWCRVQASSTPPPAWRLPMRSTPRSSA